MAVLSDSALFQLAVNTFGERLAPTMYAIAKAESGGNTSAANTNGENSIGIWQINRDAWPQFSESLLRTAEGNARAALHVLQTQGINAWTAFTGGAYRNFLPGGGGTVSNESTRQQAQQIVDEVVGYNVYLPSQLQAALVTAEYALGAGLSAEQVRNAVRHRLTEGAPNTSTGTGPTAPTGATKPGTADAPTQASLRAVLEESGYIENPPGSGVFYHVGFDGRVDDILDLNSPVEGGDDGAARLGEDRRQFDAMQDLRERQFRQDVEQFGIDEAYRRDQLRQQQGQFDTSTGLDRDRLGEDRRQFDASLGFDREQFGRGIYEDDRDFDRGVFESDRGFDRGVFESDRGYGFDLAGAAERAAMDRASLGENARQANLSSATRGFESINQLAPQLGQLALANAEFTKDTLREPSDYVARAYFSRGGTSPFPEVPQADVINKLRSNIEQFNQTISGFNPQVGAYTPPPAYQAPASPTYQPTVRQQAPAPVPVQQAPQQVQQPVDTTPGYTTTTGNPQLNYGGITLSPQEIIANSNAGLPYGGWQPTPGFARGTPGYGFIKAPPVFMGNEAGPELFEVRDPAGANNAQIRVTPNHVLPMQAAPQAVAATSKPMPGQAQPRPQIQGFQMGTKPIPGYATGTMSLGSWYDSANPYLNSGRAPGTAQEIRGSQLYDWDMPTTEQRSLYNSWNSGGITAPAGMNFAQWYSGGQPSGAPAPMSTATTAPAPAAPGPATQPMTFQPPTLPAPAPITQQEIIDAERLARPPAVDDILNGRTPTPLRTKYPLFTAIGFSRLTPDEQSALRTSLATGNESLDDYLFAMNQRFGIPNTRPRAGFAG